jgi:predicted nucleic acid-binding protein
VKLVVNSSPLIQLAACGRIELLRDLATEVIVPRAVLRELEAGRSRDRAAETVAASAWISAPSDSPLPQIVASWDLGAGESQVLAHSSITVGAIAVIDDRAARNCALAMKLPYVGTLGILTAAKEMGLIDAVRPIVEELRRAGLYLSEKVVALVLGKAGE